MYFKGMVPAQSLSENQAEGVRPSRTQKLEKVEGAGKIHAGRSACVAAPGTGALRPGLVPPDSGFSDQFGVQPPLWKHDQELLARPMGWWRARSAGREFSARGRVYGFIPGRSPFVNQTFRMSSRAGKSRRYSVSHSRFIFAWMIPSLVPASAKISPCGSTIIVRPECLKRGSLPMRFTPAT